MVFINKWKSEEKQYFLFPICFSKKILVKFVFIILKTDILWMNIVSKAGTLTNISPDIWYLSWYQRMTDLLYIKIWIMVIFWLANLELGLWKNMFFMHAIVKCQNGVQNNFQNMLCFYDSFNGLWVKSLYWYSLLWHLHGKKWLQ